MKLPAALLALLLSACATGSAVMLGGKQVELLVQPPARAYRVIALVGASAPFAGFGDVAAADGAALEKLKEQAALAGADAVIEIQRELYLGGVLITSTSLSQKPVGTVESSGPAATSPGVNYRGKAIRFD